MIGKEQNGVTATIGGAGCWIAATSARANPGECADFFSLDLNTIGYAGALHDPVAAVSKPEAANCAEHHLMPT